MTAADTTQYVPPSFRKLEASSHLSSLVMEFNELSDAGGPAFLIAAIAEYYAWLNGERDWELALKVQAKP